MEFGTSRGNILLAAKKNAEDITNGATARKKCNTHSDEMSRVSHILSYPGAEDEEVDSKIHVNGR